ncbi:MAG: threonine--tRNA ligase [Candidatus Harrisonbacteria bacterium RIFCSPHIGHO2_12_FULL_48_16]|uniref:Threonine--tRNA ligase n=1 Tax=Candidatus Harrisonbacteria bacterium RIFCSPHIGHO2_12_FULL_48_16 TaxID=1798405 RepID=A0A1G1ZKH5_9BACT|nr:MAG: threonine--tRNA ligase [Candidatus Harrisonbacteria bacterium RIFCSPHIGHO2_12_FULL_48_16]
MDKKEAKMRDHREIGQILDLFSFQEIAPGAPFWHNNGMIIFKELEKYLRAELDKNGYEEISTPIMVKKDVFEKSGHWEHYRENIFYFDNPRDKNEHLVIKPMNCPESTYVYNSKIRSYKDLPLRLAEIGRLHRNELSGTLGGLFRVRQITMDDAHIYARPEQVKEEVVAIIEMTERFYKMFRLEPTYVLATRPDKALGTKEDWQLAEKALEEALQSAGKKFSVAKGEGAFYGPKIEVHLNDSQGRDWQMGTAQLDLVMLPKQFETYYMAEDGSKKLPWVIHRAIFGSFERFIGMLLEHTDGKLPLWLSPVQAEVVNISEKQDDYARDITAKISAGGIRTKWSSVNDTINKKIREAEIRRVPYIVVIGDKEKDNKTVNVRHYTEGQLGEMTINDLLKKITTELEKKIS